jgi:hypothetical protein
MKHLKKFNEALSESNFTNFKIELEKFCNDNLAYLIDIGFKVNLDWMQGNGSNKGYIRLRIGKDKSGKERQFFWNEVMTDFIPFFELLDEKYILKNIKEGGLKRDGTGTIPEPVFLKIYCDYGNEIDRTFTKEEVINDMIEESGRLPSKILFLILEIFDKK